MKIHCLRTSSSSQVTSCNSLCHDVIWIGLKLLVCLGCQLVDRIRHTRVAERMISQEV
ncbi:BgTH12-02193 [Blumeria graminis f. sp. triticale]|uniref:Bgt-50536 n=2 Tax=Blumeria graminis TaxID=34373 RepID=A0A9X9QC86_BLUGR|nr:BgTH12-02193 [Blumeria graminis f. sp. triticale]VDB85917.1 Bgt-50536 [Blumeria graminis f. sp. tritici]